MKKRHPRPGTEAGGGRGTGESGGIFVQKWQKEIFLNAGELIFATEPCVIRTILGSCVGVALFDPVLRYGGMCHYLLAEGPPGHNSTRFGKVALRTLVGKFLRLKIDPRRLKAWIAGGGLLLNSSEIFFVGDKNIALADRVLTEFGIRPVAREVGGNKGRRMFLDTGKGEAGISRIPDTDLSRIEVI